MSSIEEIGSSSFEILLSDRLGAEFGWGGKYFFPFPLLWNALISWEF